MMTPETLMKLSVQLASFGLNPLEWNLRPLGGFKFDVRNRADQSLSFFGQLEYRNQQPFWKSLELASF